ncbi:MAG: hypothetical protein HYY06_26330 [Deltaproteobacteria bacterium]|nr:hypothetical protein [Deltaproteobacteria bacterium]
MVSIAILALALTSVFAASGGAVGATTHVKKISVATMLARCKMVEIEQQFRLEGFQVTDVEEEGPCCEDEETPGFTCRYKVESVELPEMSAVQTAAGSLMNGDPLGLGVGPPDAEGNAPGEEGDSTGLDQGLTAGLNLLYPLVSNVLQASIRRVTVDVVWVEGGQERKVEAVQFVTSPTQGVAAGQAPPPGAEAGEDSAAGPAAPAPGTGGAPR